MVGLAPLQLQVDHVFRYEDDMLLLLESNENQMKNMQKCKLFFLSQLDLCTKASCCEAAEIFNTIY